MKYIVEIKNRVFFITLNCSILFSISYYYKNVLLFLLIKQVAINQSLKFYLIYTDISELLDIYFGIVYLFTTNLSFHFILYHILIFISYALYRNEYKLINLLIFIFLFINLILSLFVVTKVYVFVWEFLQYFQRMFVFNLLSFEIKINDYYKTLLNLYIFLKYSIMILVISLLILKKIIKTTILTKFRKISFIVILLLLNIINDLSTQLSFYFLSTFYYELIILILIYKVYYNTKSNKKIF